GPPQQGGNGRPCDARLDIPQGAVEGVPRRARWQQSGQTLSVQPGPDLRADRFELVDDEPAVFAVPAIGHALPAPDDPVAIDRHDYGLDLRLHAPRDAERRLQAPTVCRAGEGLKHSSNRSMMRATP